MFYMLCGYVYRKCQNVEATPIVPTDRYIHPFKIILQAALFTRLYDIGCPVTGLVIIVVT
jgi:hypothetical protein